MNNKKLAILGLLLAAGCASDKNMSGDGSGGSVVNPTRGELVAPPLDPKRKISEQDCSRPVEIADGNLKCSGEPSEAQKRAIREEEERLARARKEAADRAARALAERERAEREAREAAERAEQERLARLAAEQARLEAERRAKLEEEERQARALKEAEERAARERAERERAEQEAREAAERERQRLEQEWLAGRALLEQFMANYGKVDKFKDVAAPIGSFLDKTR
jgi:hypothetical protein